MTYTPALLFLGSDNSTGLTAHERPEWYLDAEHPMVALALTNVTGVKTSPDGSRIAVLRSFPRSLAVYEVATGDLVFSTTTVGSSPYYGLDWSPDGALIAVPTGSSPYVRLYNAETGAVIAGLPTFTQSCYCAAFSPDSSELALGFGSAPRLAVLDIPTKTLVSGVSAANSVSSLAWSPDGQRLAVAGVGRQVFDTVTWSAISAGDLAYSDSLATSVVFSANGDRLLVARRTGAPKLRLYDTATWTLSAGVDLSAVTAWVNQPVLSTDGAIIAIPLGTSATAFVYTSDWTLDPEAVAPLYSASSASAVAAFGGAYVPPPTQPFWTNYRRAAETL